VKKEEILDEFCSPADERALLSCAFKSMDIYYTICSKMTADDFLYTDHKIIFLLIKNILETDKNVEKLDFELVYNKALSNGVLEQAGGTDYLRTISEMIVSPENFNSYLQTVLEASTKYKLYLGLHADMDLVLENAKAGMGSDDLIGSIQSTILDISTSAKSISEPKNLSDGLAEYIEERRVNPVDMSGLPTGYVILDRQIDGLIPGTVTIVSARKKMGKSALLSNIAARVAYIQHKPVLYIDTEMTFPEWRNRLIAMLSGIEERRIKHGDYSDDEYKNIIEKCVSIADSGKLFHEYMPGYSIDKMTALYKKYKVKEDIGLAVFDYIKEPDTSSLDRARKEFQILGDVTTRIKDLAGQLDIPFLTAVQINREGEVAGSDRISWFGDVVMQWTDREQEEIEQTGYEGGNYKLIIRDSRRGGQTPTEGIGYVFRKKRLQIDEAPIPNQLYHGYEKGVVNYGSDDEEIN